MVWIIFVACPHPYYLNEFIGYDEDMNFGQPDIHGYDSGYGISKIQRMRII